MLSYMAYIWIRHGIQRGEPAMVVVDISSRLPVLDTMILTAARCGCCCCCCCCCSAMDATAARCTHRIRVCMPCVCHLPSIHQMLGSIYHTTGSVMGYEMQCLRFWMLHQHQMVFLVGNVYVQGHVLEHVNLFMTSCSDDSSFSLATKVSPWVCLKMLYMSNGNVDS